MEKSSYNIKDVYKDISTINDYFSESNQSGAIIQKTENIIHKYCHFGNTSGNGQCRDYFEMASSGVIHLLEHLKKYNLGYDKLAEYAILWLSYKLAVKPTKKMTDLNKFYNKYIETNECYNSKINGNDGLTYKAIIDKKKDLMNIKEISHFDNPFSLLCNLYNKTNNETLVCGLYLDYANLFAESFKKRSQLSNNKEGSLYNKLLSILSDDYNHLKKKCVNFPSIPEIKHKKSPVINPEATSSSSSISTTLIPALSVFPVIPVFLGIAYKYSLFGIDKLFQRQYLRKKLKKVKKKMKLNI
ncbi:CIR protein PIR protein [Plasmodium vinckei brucechwatti]|uniref:CIR protein PIR protein n=1 Tax=Plasmodium vinckei brucechwatti TaxID=119398 RepID=A0A6V7S0A9_PLAVN|nr:CIR protein PIR protein [Plasmodium vinckei brucechwatti]